VLLGVWEIVLEGVAETVLETVLLGVALVVLETVFEGVLLAPAATYSSAPTTDGTIYHRSPVPSGYVASLPIIGGGMLLYHRSHVP
jgi:hypothetical protein